MRRGPTTNRIRLRLRDAGGRLVETLEDSPEVAARKAGDFLIEMGSDPDEHGAAATTGSIEFEPVSPGSTSPERTVGQVVLTDPAGKRPSLTVRITASASQIYLRPEGYGEPDACHGSPAFLDLFDGQLQLVVCRDINEPEPLLISLEAARESGRRP